MHRFEGLGCDYYFLPRIFRQSVESKGTRFAVEYRRVANKICSATIIP